MVSSPVTMLASEELNAPLILIALGVIVLAGAGYMAMRKRGGDDDEEEEAAT